MNPKPTLIIHISWGHMEVAVGDHVLQFKDCKVWPGGAVAWDWKLTGTRHQPGIQPADIKEILAQGVETLVLSRGMQLMLDTCPQTEQLLQKQEIEYFIEETTEAVDRFNRLTQDGKRVGGIFHSTC